MSNINRLKMSLAVKNIQHPLTAGHLRFFFHQASTFIAHQPDLGYNAFVRAGQPARFCDETESFIDAMMMLII